MSPEVPKKTSILAPGARCLQAWRKNDVMAR